MANAAENLAAEMGSLIAKGEDFSVVIAVWTENPHLDQGRQKSHRAGRWNNAGALRSFIKAVR
jgi:hypothetical protein